MKSLNKLIERYKKTKDKDLLTEIFLFLSPIIRQKATYIYYEKTFNYHNKNFKLSKINKLEFEDVLQELNVFVLELIDKYKSKMNFRKYLYSSIWNWRPSFIRTKQFISEIDDISEENLTYDESDNRGFDTILFINPEIKEQEKNILKCFRRLSIQEKKLINFILKNSTMTQTQIADRLKVTQQRVSQILKNLRNKYNKGL
jgi:RNA polymerase sigma factor (sigma-70 family)